MNDKENHKLDVLIERVDWIRDTIKELKEKDIVEIKETAKCQVDYCHERMNNQEKKISDKILFTMRDIKRRIYYSRKARARNQIQ